MLQHSLCFDIFIKLTEGTRKFLAELKKRIFYNKRYIFFKQKNIKSR